MKTIAHPIDLYYSSITEVGDLVKEGKVTPRALVEVCIDRIHRYNAQLNAFITVMEDEALRYADEAGAAIQNGRWLGPLHGIPVAVKDFYDTANVRTTAAFEHFQNRVPGKDADVVARLGATGAIIIGKTNMDRLGMGTTGLTGYFGPVHNPWNEKYIAGGSSGGSAAAVAAGMCFATVDTDAIGSCRLPAACCGVTGFKVSPGLISMKGILEGEKADEMILMLSQTGITTRTIADTAIMLEALATKKTDLPDYYRKPIVGVVTNFEATSVVREKFLAAVESFRALGYATREVEVPFQLVSMDIKNIVADRQKIDALAFKDANVLFLPATTDSTPTIDKAQEAGPQALSGNNTMFCNYFGLPAVSVPCGFDDNGLPIGLQIVGGNGRENDVIQVAKAYEQANRWHLERPLLQ